MRRVPLGLLVTLSARSVWSHKVKSLVVGSILAFGTVLVVVGTALLGTLEETMTKSITSSMAGDIQIYSSAAKDPLQLFGGMGMGSPDYGDIDSPASLDPIAAIDNVKEVVPMGITLATVFGPSQLDRVLEELRTAAKEGDEETVQNLVPQVRRIARSLRQDREGAGDLVANGDKLRGEIALLDRVDSDPFWTGDFSADRLGTIELLEQKVAPLAEDGKMLFLQTVGTDLEQFARTFDRFAIVKGRTIPPGRRGILLSDRIYERDVKNLVARELDVLWDDVRDGAVIADDPAMQEAIRRNSRQYARVTFGLSAHDAERLERELRAILPDVSGDLDALTERFLLVDDTTIAARHQFFYDVIAPMIELYDFPVGSTIPLRAYTKSGYVRSIKVEIYGTYQFDGLEKSDIAAASNLTDLVTFRELFGKMTDAQQAELASIRADVGVRDVSRDAAEAELFGSGGTVEAQAAEATDSLAALETTRFAVAGVADDRTFTPEEMRNGLFVNAAVLLEDPKRLDETLAAIRETIAERGLPLQAVDWQTAAGIVGQFLWVVRAILLIMMTIIFLVALLVINNSMVVATLERVGEIGSMRAIGARRGLVVGMFMGETVLLGVLSGIVGILLSVASLQFLHAHGIPATHDVLVLLFAGPRLYPEITLGSVVFGFVTVIGIGIVSTFYPALLAAWVQPITAMRAKE